MKHETALGEQDCGAYALPEQHVERVSADVQKHALATADFVLDARLDKVSIRELTTNIAAETDNMGRLRVTKLVSKQYVYDNPILIQ